MPPKFLYFDLGNVLLNFDHRLACRQMGEVAGVPEQVVWDVVFEGDLEERYESGQVDDRGFYEAFCSQTGSRPDYNALLRAGSEIFRANGPILPIVSHLDAAGYPMGILSNTCPGHWSYCRAPGRYHWLHDCFDVFALSYQIGVCKPDPKIFRAAAELASVRPQDIFYVDDIAGHVSAAQAAGFDAVQYTTPARLAADLRERGVQFNY